MEKIETKRLILRKFKKEDAKNIYDGWASDSEVTKYLTWNPHESIKITEKLLNSWLESYKDEKCYRFAIDLKNENKLIGMIDVVGYENNIPKIGYVLSRQYWNKGYMTEAFKKFIEYLFSKGFNEIHIEADENNYASNAVIKKNGFEFFEKETKIKSKFKNEIVTVNKYKLKK